MKLTDALMAEHAVFHSIFASLEKAIPHFSSLGEFRTAATMLLGTLEDHGRAEHELLLPPIEPYLNDIGHLENFHQEDDAIIANLRHTIETSTPADAKSHLQRALRLASEHFDKEERLVFRLAEEHISEASLHELGDRWRSMKDLSPQKPVKKPSRRN